MSIEWLLGWRVVHQIGGAAYLRNVFTGKRKARRNGAGILDTTWVTSGKLSPLASPLTPPIKTDLPN